MNELNFAALAVKIGANIQDLQAKLVTASGDLKKFTKDNSESLRALGTTFTAMGAAIIGTYALMARTSTKFADEILIASKRTGIATDTLSRLKYVADQTESSFEAMTTGLKFLSRNMYEASQSNQTVIRAFADLGINITGADGKMKNLLDVFYEVADAAPNTAQAMALLGRGGQSLIPIFEMGSAAIKKMGLEATRIISPEDTKKLDDLSDKTRRLGDAFGGLSDSIMVTLAPALKDLVESLTGVIQGLQRFAKAHPDLTRNIVILVGALGILSLTLGTTLLLAGQFAVALNAIATASLLVKTGTIAAAGGVGILGAAFKSFLPILLALAAVKGFDWLLKQSPVYKKAMKDNADATDFVRIAVQKSKEEIEAEGKALKSSLEYFKIRKDIETQIQTLLLDTTALKIWSHNEEMKMKREEIEANDKLLAPEKKAALEELSKYDTAYKTSLKAAGGGLDEYNAKVEAIGASFLKIRGDAIDVFGEMPSIFEDTFGNVKSVMGDFFTDSFKGQLKDVGDYWQAFTESMRASFANMIADMVTRYLWGKAVGLVLNFFGGSAGTIAGGMAGGSVVNTGAQSAGGQSFTSAWSPPAGSYATGTDYVPHTGMYQLHEGETVGTKGERNSGITIINVIDEKLVPAILSKYPDAVLNIVNENLLRQGSTRKMIKREA